MKDSDGYTLRRNYDGGGDYLLHEYIVDGCNIEGEPEQGMWTIEDTDRCRTRKEAMQSMREFCKRYDKATIYDQWVEAVIDDNGWTHMYSTVEQTIEDYIDGKLIRKSGMI